MPKPRSKVNRANRYKPSSWSDYFDHREFTDDVSNIDFVELMVSIGYMLLLHR